MEVTIIPDDKIPLNTRPAPAPGKQGHPASGIWRYGMLVFILGIIGFYIHWWFNVPPHYPYDRYSVGISGVVLLLQHLSDSFRWPRRTSIGLRIMAHGSLVFGIIWVCYLSKQIYP